MKNEIFFSYSNLSTAFEIESFSEKIVSFNVD